VGRGDRVGPEISESIDAYVAAVGGRGPTEVLVHPAGHHAFDVVDDDATSADLIRRTIAFLLALLGPGQVRQDTCVECGSSTTDRSPSL
jgi:hypothetical protein